jgi:DNA topoisomerase-3
MSNNPYKVGDHAPINEVVVEAKKTTPPKPFTDETLLVAMENAHHYIEDANLRAALKHAGGIGTPATRGPTIEKLVDIKYITAKKEKGGRKLLPTPRVIEIVESLEAMKSEVVNVGLSALMEAGLAAIGTGKIEYRDFMERQNQWVIAQTENILRAAPPKKERQTRPCSGCGCSGGGMLTRYDSKFGGEDYWRCSVDGCKKTFTTLNNEPVEKVAAVKIEVADEDKLPGDGDSCPKCKKGKMKTKVVSNPDSKAFGRRYLACTNYPACKHSEWEK